MKKINIFAFTIIIFFIPSTHGMEQATTEVNQQFPMMRLPADILNKICFHTNNSDQNFRNFIKSALALRSTSSYFNKLLTAEQLGQFCAPYNQEIKNNTLKDIMRITNDINYTKLRFPYLILIYGKAHPDIISYCPEITLLERTLYYKDLSFTKILLQHKADPNKSYFSNPPLFHAQTKECAQLLIEYGADIQIKNTIVKTNILWHLIRESGSPQEIKLDFLQFYLDKGVDPKALRPCDNICLFHYLVEYAYLNNYDTTFARILFSVIPEMINTINIKGQTPLDIAIKNKEDYNKIKQKQYSYISRYFFKSYKKDYENLKKFIIFLQENGAKTAQELEEAKNNKQEQPIINENESNHCLICLMDEKLISIPCDNKHLGSKICQDCCNQLLNNNKPCPLCREKLKK